MIQDQQKQKIQLKEYCDICGKPVSTGKASSDVTRYLSFESRCTCVTSGQNDGETSGEDAEAHMTLVPSMSKQEVEDNLGEDFQVIELLGQGGMGVVYKVKDKRLDKTFAIKVLNPALVEDKQSIKRFEQEATAAKALTHVNLAAVYDFGVGAKGAPYLVMDFLDGKSLGEILQDEGYLDVPRSIDIFIQIAEAVASAHAHGVIHRDIKPNNVIVCKTNGIEMVKLVDFGIAKVLPSETRSTQMTQTGEILGSPLYMAPEQCVGNRVDQRSDIYALGCLMYEMLTGKPPFEAENPIKVILKHITDEPAKFSALSHDYKIPESLERVIFHCLEKDPNERYSSAEALARDLEAIRDGKPVSIAKQVSKKPPTVKAQTSNAHPALLLLVPFMLAVFVYSSSLPPRNPTITATTPPLITTTDPYAEADEYDRRAAQLCGQGQYAKAIDLLMFNLHTYKLDGNPQHESYLADCTQHVGQCYLKMKDYKSAQKYYRDGLSIYNKWGGYPGGMMQEAVNDYAQTLRGLGETTKAEAMLKDWQESRNANGYPYLKQIP